MPSPKSREIGFFYMHPQNRFWSVMAEVFGETLAHPNNAPDHTSAIEERRDFLLRHHLAMWDVLASCEITGAADSSIKNAIPNDFSEILENSKVRQIICTGKTSFNLWQKNCAALYEPRYNLTVHCLPSTSPANAQWSKEKLIEEYKAILKLLHE
jgi:hypoxanthine-DNA glycosylase